MLCSDLIPRWAIIGWLLTSCTNPTALANAKLALFYDWLFFDPMKDNIMNVEPGILVMYHSIRNHPLVSSTLLDFLCRIMKNFAPKNEDRIRMGVFNSLRKILEKQVIPNLYPLFESPKLDRELKSLIRDNFREFCGGGGGGGSPHLMNDINHHFHMDVMPSAAAVITNNQYHNDDSRLQQQQQQQLPHQHQQQQHPHQQQPINNQMEITMENTKIIRHDAAAAAAAASTTRSDETDLEAKFSDDEEQQQQQPPPQTEQHADVCVAVKNEETDDDDDLPLSKVRLKEKPVPDKVDLPAAINGSFEKFCTARTSAALDTFFTDLRTCPAMDAEQETYVVDNIALILRATLPTTNIYPESKNDEKQLALSISYPLFSVFKVMYQYEEKLKKSVANVIRTVLQKMPPADSVGSFMLYFLKVYAKLQARKSTSAAAANVSFKTNLYKILCDYLDTTVDERLSKDLAGLEMDSAQMFLWILPDVYREFKGHMLNNSEVLRTLVGCVDAKSLRDLIYSVTQGKLTLFQNDGVLQCVRDSLDYETFEQYCLWQLVQAHDVPIDCLQVSGSGRGFYIFIICFVLFQDLLPDLESSNHAEALTYMLLLLKNEKPTPELIRLLLSRETKSRGDQFVTSALRYEGYQVTKLHMVQHCINILTF